MSSSLASPQPLEGYRPTPASEMKIPSFASNNPFRRAVSPQAAAPSAASPPPAAPTSSHSIPTDGSGAYTNNGQARAKPTTNPFLDNYRAPPPPPVANMPPPPRPVDLASPPKPQPRQLYDGPVPRRQPPVDASRGATEQLNGLVLGERPQGRPVPDRALKPRGPYPQRDPAPFDPNALTHRSRRSDDIRRLRQELLAGNKNVVADPFARSSRSPEKKENRRPLARRNSDTSILEFSEASNGGAAAAAAGSSGRARAGDDRARRPKKSNRQVDLIDKLDVTGVFGVGMFHHDGPFDACNPHRNRKGHRAAPMQAFAEGSLNNVIGGSGPLNKNIDLDRIHGRGVDGFDDYNSSSAAPLAARKGGVPRRPVGGPEAQQGAPRPANNYIEEYRQNKDNLLFDDPKGMHKLHGEETAGLGTSTFLEGAPAPRSVLQRRESENETAAAGSGFGSGGGLTRKRSLAHKLGMARQRYEPDRSALAPSPEGVPHAEGGRALSPRAPQHAQSAGGPSKMNEVNPFFHDVGGKGAGVEERKVDPSVQIVESREQLQRPRNNSSPPRGPGGLLKRLTNDASSPPEPEGKAAGGGSGGGGGLLSRMKSLKASRRPDRQEQRVS